MRHILYKSGSGLERVVSTNSTNSLSLPRSQELLKKCHQCMETIVKAKDQQAAEANKNASILLKELDLEKSREESKKQALAAKREKRKEKRKKKKEEQKRKQEEEEEEQKTTKEEDEEEDSEMQKQDDSAEGKLYLGFNI